LKRVIVLGGFGRFGSSIIEQLRSRGVPAMTAARRKGGDYQVDANDADSIRSALTDQPLVIDAAGPFQQRSMALLDAAIELGFDLIDINDDLEYAEQVLAREAIIARAGIRVLSSASSVSAISTTMVGHSGFKTPSRVTAFLAPATRHTANAGSALSLIRSVGRPIRVFREGRLQTRPGWCETRSFDMPDPVGSTRGRLFESADAVYLPRIWPSLREVEMYVDPRLPGVNSLLGLGSRLPAIRRSLECHVRFGTWMARVIGSTAGGIGYEVEDANGDVAGIALSSPRHSFMTAVAPAVLAAQAIANDRFPYTGLVLPDRQVDPAELLSYLESSGVGLSVVGG
jgi:hypothetical protein